MASLEVAKMATQAKISMAMVDLEKGKTKEKLDEIQNEEGENEGCSWQTMAVQCVAAAAMIMNILAIAVEAAAPTVVVAGVFIFLIAPVVMILQMTLQNTDTMTEVQNSLRREVNRLQVENNTLESEINVLEEEVTELKVQEKRLGEITEKAGTNVEEFVALVKENRSLIEKEKLVVRQETTQLLSSIVINSDHDKSGVLEEREVRLLTAKLRCTPSDFINKSAFEVALKETGGSVAEMLKMIFHFTHDHNDRKENGETDNKSVDLTK
mmetsp:Transcript_6064/g.7832  ORF Transcript_6064/g.7832 Transcript_6064/m.7832 type:complete len:268 (-) Transcript_6064:381-1184(-)|eukprot:CAMPEP_0198147258 /NCGR_PEP_ID=MMETSP1443-20131203/34292_1 /TAXON_ID=186043 /ORGANISM="Entomoneis sp., Strain CCMP2396" /LENGTH=267 /DNA_ID=CAMNT_0043811507 /DNA_START=120 /DNA_END=923 /DNA_ORIENTATION=+